MTALRLLADRGIPAIPFKGPLLAIALYGDLGLRPFCDVDLLLPRERVSAAVDALVADGFTVVAPRDRSALLSRLRCVWLSDLQLARGDATVELHWRLTPALFGVRDTIDDIASGLEDVEVAGQSARTLSPATLFLYLCIHGATHRWARLEWICDVAELLRRNPPIDWRRLRQLARAKGSERMLGLAVFLAADLLGAPPPPIVSDLAHGAAVRRLASAVYRHLPNEKPDPASPWIALSPFHLAMRERLRDRARYGLAMVFAPSPRDIEALRLPQSLFPAYYLVRPLRLAAAYSVAMARRLVRRRPASPEGGAL